MIHVSADGWFQAAQLPEEAADTCLGLHLGGVIAISRLISKVKNHTKQILAAGRRAAARVVATVAPVHWRVAEP